MSLGKEKRREGGLKKFIRTTFTLILCIASFLLGSKFGGGLGFGFGMGSGNGTSGSDNVTETKVDKGQEYVDKVTEQGNTTVTPAANDRKDEAKPSSTPAADPTSAPTATPTPIPAPEKTEYVITFNQTEVFFDGRKCESLDALRESIVANQNSGNTLPYVIKMENAYGTTFDTVKEMFDDLSKNDSTVKYIVN